MHGRMMHSPYAHYIFMIYQETRICFNKLRYSQKTFAPSLVGSTENVVPPLVVVESVPVVGVELKVSVDTLISATVDDDSASEQNILGSATRLALIIAKHTIFSV